MFGSNDDKKAPAAAGEKKGLFSWFRKKPQQPVAEQPQTPEPQATEPAALRRLLPSRCRRRARARSVAPLPEPVRCAAAEPCQSRWFTPQPAPVAAVVAQPVVAAPAVHPVEVPAAPVSNLVLPVAEEPVALVENLEPKAPPAIPARPFAEPVPLSPALRRLSKPNRSSSDSGRT
jgi:fused signal recognition particle receptor